MELVIALRLVHIVLGALWVGMMAFTVFFLTPAIRDAGPEGGKVMAALIAFILGIVVVRPAMVRANASSDPVEIQRLRARGAAVGRVVALLLILAAAAMAVARYL